MLAQLSRETTLGIRNNSFRRDETRPTKQRDYRASLAGLGLEPEIDLLSKTIVSIVEKGDPRNFRLLPHALKTLVSLVRTNDQIRVRTSTQPTRVNEPLDQFLSRLVQKSDLSSE